MKKIHICYALSGYEEIDFKRYAELTLKIPNIDFSAYPVQGSNFMGSVTMEDDDGDIAEKKVKLILIESGVVDEVWVFGSINGEMLEEIYAAVNRGTPIKCMDYESKSDYESMNIPKVKDLSEIMFWALFGVAIFIVACVMFLLLLNGKR